MLSLWDVITGLIKPMFFGAAIAVISLPSRLPQRGRRRGRRPGGDRAFVASFIAILVLDFFLAMFLNNLHDFLWPANGAEVVLDAACVRAAAMSTPADRP